MSGRRNRLALSFSIILLVTSSYAQSPVANWTFSDPNNLGADSSGNGYNLTEELGTNGQIKPADGPGGRGAASFNGSAYMDFQNSDLENFPTNLPINNSSYTITAWIDPGTIVGGAHGIIGWGAYETSDATNAFRTDNNGGIINYSWSDDAIYDPAGFSVYDGNWHFVAVTYDSTTGNRFVYIDPATSNLSPYQSNPKNTLGVQATNFAVGATCFTCGGGREYFKGEMSQIEVFNSALTSAQIDSLDSTSPEPATLLLAISAIGLLLLRRRFAT
jgi:hypothetical protein